MSFLDEAPNSNSEFPLPSGESPLPETVPVGDRVQVKAPCKEWTLLDMRSNSGIGENNRTVVNLRVRGNDQRYPHTGEVAYWFDAKQLDNPKHPARRTMAMLAKLAVKLELSDADDWANPSGETMMRLIHQAASKNTPKAVINGALVWEARGWEGREGPQTSHNTELRFVEFKSLVEEASDSGDSPF